MARFMFSTRVVLFLHFKGFDIRQLGDYHTGRVRPIELRVGTEFPKGFYRADFEREWERYLSVPLSSPLQAATSATSATRDRGNVAAVATVAPSDNRVHTPWLFAPHLRAGNKKKQFLRRFQRKLNSRK